LTGFFQRILSKGPKAIDVAKSGDNYYSLVRINEEVVMAVVQPPTSFSGQTNVSGDVSVFDATGNLQVNRGKITNYGEPFILFNPNNKAGLQLINAKQEAKALLPEALQNRPDIKIETANLDKSDVITVKEHERVVLPSGGVLQLNEDKTVLVFRTPKVEESDRKVLNSLLQLLVISLVGGAQTYRSNIMLLDPGDNRLKIAARYNMDGYPDKNISLAADAGGAGVAFRQDRVNRLDLNVTPHQTLNVDPLAVWPGMKSIYSLPIHDSDNAILGVLSVDTDQLISTTRLYNDQNFDRSMILASESFGFILENNI
jgi:hypothetical protein